MLAVLCRACGNQLSVALEPTGIRSYEDRHAIVKEGTFCAGPDETLLIQINLADLRGVRLNPASGNRYGCCGYDGCNGPNLICSRCENPVGSALTECYVPHGVHFAREATELRDADKSVVLPLSISTRRKRSSTGSVWSAKLVGAEEKLLRSTTLAI